MSSLLLQPKMRAIGLSALALYGSGETAMAEGVPAQRSEAGFVVTDIAYALGKEDEQSLICPAGMSQSMRLDVIDPATGKTITPAEAEKQFMQRMRDTTQPHPCLNPEKVGPDPLFRVMRLSKVNAFGIDIDGHASGAQAKATPGTCAHEDLLGVDGKPGVDNQFFRLVGCVPGYRSSAMGNQFATEMLTGAWGILIRLKGVDDLRNDDHVEVGIYANADPIELSANREALPHVTYAASQDARFRAMTSGRIKDGVLTTTPVDVRFHKITNGMYLERPLREARLQVSMNEDGSLEGYLAGYTPIEDLYDFEFAFRNAKDAKGVPLDLMRTPRNSASGRSRGLHYTCNGVYHALHELADGHPDASTMKCTSISTQYRLKAIAAFIVDVKTESLNDALAR